MIGNRPEGSAIRSPPVDFHRLPLVGFSESDQME